MCSHAIVSSMKMMLWKGKEGGRGEDGGGDGGGIKTKSEKNGPRSICCFRGEQTEFADSFTVRQYTHTHTLVHNNNQINTSRTRQAKVKN